MAGQSCGLIGIRLGARPNWLRLFAQPAPRNNLARTPNVIAQKFPALTFTVQTRIDASHLREGAHAGLIILGREHAALAISPNGASHSISLIINNHRTTFATLDAAVIDLRVEISDGGECTFSYAGQSGEFQSLSHAFQSREGKWMGAKVGLFCISADAAPLSGHADFDYLRFSPPLRHPRETHVLDDGKTPTSHVVLETIHPRRPKRQRVKLSNIRATEIP